MSESEGRGGSTTSGSEAWRGVGLRGEERAAGEERAPGEERVSESGRGLFTLCTEP